MPRVAQQSDRVLLHRLQQGGLSLGAGAVDLVGQEDIGEDRAALKVISPAARRFPQNVRAQNVAGHEVGRELHAAKLQVQNLPQGLDEGRFSHAGQTFQQDVPSAEDAGQHHAVQLVPAQQDRVELPKGPIGQGDGGRQIVGLQQGVNGRVAWSLIRISWGRRPYGFDFFSRLKYRSTVFSCSGRMIWACARAAAGLGAPKRRRMSRRPLSSLSDRPR